MPDIARALPLLAFQVPGVLELDVRPVALVLATLTPAAARRLGERNPRPARQLRYSLRLLTPVDPSLRKDDIRRLGVDRLAFARSIQDSVLPRQSRLRRPTLLVLEQTQPLSTGSSRRSALSWRSRSRYSDREVNSRYGSSTPRLHQVVDQHADESLVSTEDDRLASRAPSAAALIPATTPWPAASSYPVVPFTWPARNSPGNALQLERRMKLSRREVVVLDRVTRPSHSHRLETRNARRNSSCTSAGSEVESPLTYISDVSRPSGSRKTWCRGASGNLTILSSIDGQYRGPRPQIAPRRAPTA